VNTNCLADAGDGILWCQSPGNWFAARNAVTNYGLEGINLNSGPTAAVANDFFTFVSLGATVAFLGIAQWDGPTGSTNDYVLCAVGNDIQGGRDGASGHAFELSTLRPYRIQFAGNRVKLYPAFQRADDQPAAAIGGYVMNFSQVSGNTLVAGGYGVRWLDTCTDAVVLKNDFSAATFRGLSYDGTNGAVRNLTIIKNVLGQGTTFHFHARPEDGTAYFLIKNAYSNGVTGVNAFIDPQSGSVHWIH